MQTNADRSVTIPGPRALEPRPPALLALAALLVLALAASPALAGPSIGARAAAGTDEAGAAEGPRWHTRIAPALAEAEASGKLVLVDLYADWCGWCKKLDVEFRTDHFTEFARNYVLLRVDVEDGGEGGELRSHLGVRALPTLALMNHDQVRVGLVQGFKQAPILTTSIRRVVAQWQAERKAIETLVATGDRQERLAAADRLRAMLDGGAAAKVYRGVLAEKDLDAGERARVGAALADSLLMVEDAPAARRALEQARQAAADTEDGMERTKMERILDTLDLRLADQLADCQHASALEHFLREHPSSTVAGHARSRLSELRNGPAADCS